MPIYEKPLKGTEPTKDEIEQAQAADAQGVQDAAPAQFGSPSVFSRAQSDQDTAEATDNND